MCNTEPDETFYENCHLLLSVVYFGRLARVFVRHSKCVYKYTRYG